MLGDMRRKKTKKPHTFELKHPLHWSWGLSDFPLLLTRGQILSFQFTPISFWERSDIWTFQPWIHSAVQSWFCVLWQVLMITSQRQAFSPNCSVLLLGWGKNWYISYAQSSLRFYVKWLSISVSLHAGLFLSQRATVLLISCMCNLEVALL